MYKVYIFLFFQLFSFRVEQVIPVSVEKENEYPHWEWTWISCNAVS